jgi:tRNA(fMet)-specific endonuclease VapC
MAFLLDTNAWIVYLKSAASPIRTRLENLTPADVRLCSVVKAELLHGAEKYGNRERRLAILEETCRPYVSLPFDDAAATAYARIRHQLELGGNIIGPNDLIRFRTRDNIHGERMTHQRPGSRAGQNKVLRYTRASSSLGPVGADDFGGIDEEFDLPAAADDSFKGDGTEPVGRIEPVHPEPYRVATRGKAFFRPSRRQPPARQQRRRGRR